VLADFSETSKKAAIFLGKGQSERRLRAQSRAAQLSVVARSLRNLACSGGG
jgi:hypothetical protein